MRASMAARSRSPPRWTTSRAIPWTSRCRSCWWKRKSAIWAKTAFDSIPWWSAPSAAKRAKATRSRPTAREPSTPVSIWRRSVRISGSSSTSTRPRAIAARRSSSAQRKTRSTAATWPWWFSCRTIRPGMCCKPVTSISARPSARIPSPKSTEATNNEEPVFGGGHGCVPGGGPGGSRRLETARPSRGARESRRPIQREVAGGGTGRLASLLLEAHGGGADPDAHLDRRRTTIFAGWRRAGAGPAGDAGCELRHGSGTLRRAGGGHTAAEGRLRRGSGRAETGGERLVSVLQQQTVPAAEDGQGGSADHDREVVESSVPGSPLLIYVRFRKPQTAKDNSPRRQPWEALICLGLRRQARRAKDNSPRRQPWGARRLVNAAPERGVRICHTASLPCSCTSSSPPRIALRTYLPNSRAAFSPTWAA